MWIYYCCMKYIDCGFKSIHMGQVGYWSKLDNPNYPLSNSQTTANRQTLSNLLGKIRQYAQQQNSFVIMEPELAGTESYVLNNVMLFDFNCIACWPAEVSTLFTAQNDYTYCTSTVNGNMFQNTPCSNSTINATIDPCHDFLGKVVNISGYSPSYNCYFDHAPFVIKFDHQDGIFGNVHNFQPSARNVWNYDDQRWYSTLDDKCAAYWIRSHICKINQNFTYGGGRGFISAPGRLLIGNKTQFGDMTDNLTYYSMSEHPDVVNAVADAWRVGATPSISMEQRCDYPIGSCWYDNHGPDPNQQTYTQYQNAYYFILNNPDCNSIYTWHVLLPNNQWLPFTRGNSRVIVPTMAGIYHISVRQDNFALMPQPYVQVGSLDVSMDMSTCCIADVIDPPNYHRFSIAPNPVIDYTYVKTFSEKNSVITISLFSLDNVEKINKHYIASEDGLQSNRIDMSNLPQGLYFIKVNDEQNVEYFKVLKE